jgi:excisionase family DNA binding protein
MCWNVSEDSWDRGGVAVDPLLLTPAQAAKVLSLSRTVVYELIGKNELESIKLGASRRIPVAALQEWVERQREGAKQSANAPA